VHCVVDFGTQRIVKIESGAISQLEYIIYVAAVHILFFKMNCVIAFYFKAARHFYGDSHYSADI